MSSKTVKPEDLDWVQLRKDMDESLVVESALDKGFRKFKEAPFIPIGCALTSAALIYGVYSFARGRSMMSQYMMRARVLGQGATIVAVLFTLTTLPKKN